MRGAGGALLDRIGQVVCLLTRSLATRVAVADPGRPGQGDRRRGARRPAVPGVGTVGPPDYFREGSAAAVWPDRNGGRIRPQLTTRQPTSRSAGKPAGGPGYARCHLLTVPGAGQASGPSCRGDHRRRLLPRRLRPLVGRVPSPVRHPVDHVLLAHEGIHGNCHMMMLERNSDEIAAVIHRWLKGHDSQGGPPFRSPAGRRATRSMTFRLYGRDPAPHTV